MMDNVTVTATYDKSSKVPKIGQRVRMRVNGRPQLLTLNELQVKRRGVWDETRAYFYYVFNTQEEWGDFFVTS
jgi:hypothetical protein